MLQTCRATFARWPALEPAAKRTLPERLHAPVRSPTRSTRRRGRKRSAPPPACGGATRRSGARTPTCRRRSRTGSAGSSSPQLMADSLDRLQAFADRSNATASPTSCCSAWADRASRPKCCARSSASRRAGRGCTCSTRPTRRRSAPPPRRPIARCICWRASRARRSSRTRWPPISASGWRTPASRAGPIISSRSPTKAPSSPPRARRKASATSSSIRRTSAAATRRCRSSAWCRPR